MAKKEMNEEERRESQTRALITAMIKIRVSQGADILDLLDEIPASIHADIVERLVRLGVM